MITDGAHNFLKGSCILKTHLEGLEKMLKDNIILSYKAALSTDGRRIISNVIMPTPAKEITINIKPTNETTGNS